MQLDNAERGFSFRLDGPLDMRMSGEGVSAAEVVNAASERDLADIIFTLGEERHSRAIARAIVQTRDQAAIRTTKALAEAVMSVMSPRPADIHPATRTFQALRIFVNGELGELIKALQAAERVLKVGGQLVVVSFHSLEDRIVKMFFTDRGRSRAGSRHAPEIKQAVPTFSVLTKRPVIASDADRPQSESTVRQVTRRRTNRRTCARRCASGHIATVAVTRRRVERALKISLLNILVIGALILAASFVYKIKFNSTLQVERVAKLRGELRRERNAIATLRTEWGRLETPGRIQALADRHLALQPANAFQFDKLDRLPERPPRVVPAPNGDPIGAMLAPVPDTTGSVPAPR